MSAVQFNDSKTEFNNAAQYKNVYSQTTTNSVWAVGTNYK